MYPEDLNIAFGRILRDERVRHSMSQEHLADTAGYDRTYVSMLERGKRQPTLKAIFLIASALQISPSTLVKRVERYKTEAPDE